MFGRSVNHLEFAVPVGCRYGATANKSYVKRVFETSEKLISRGN